MRECCCNGTTRRVFHGIVYDIGYDLLQFVAVGGDAIVSAVCFGVECEGELARVYVWLDFGDCVLYELFQVYGIKGVFHGAEFDATDIQVRLLRFATRVILDTRKKKPYGGFLKD